MSKVLELCERVKEYFAPWKPRKVWNLWEHKGGWGWNVYFIDFNSRRIVG